MGTTLTGAYVIGLDAFIAHVGDSRAYLYRERALTRLTSDHTLAQEMLDAGLPAPEAKRHVLTNVLGGAKRDVRIDFHHVQLRDGDRLLFCSDGLTEMVADERIASLLAENVDPQAACQVLIDAALANGGRDNVTAVVANVALVPDSAAG
jgi:protein phosphatase